MPKKNKHKMKMGLYKVRHRWQDEWQDMPEFIQEDLTPYKSLLVHFENEEDMKEFSKLIDRNITVKTQSIWYPKEKIGRMSGRYYVTDGYRDES